MFVPCQKFKTTVELIQLNQINERMCSTLAKFEDVAFLQNPLT